MDPHDPPPKRTDVGYKRPPIEHQFKTGQKPPPRKKKQGSKDNDPRQVFWEVLQEPRRAIIDGKVRWVTTAELLVRISFTEAEKGSPTLQRLLNQLLLGKAKPGESAWPDVIFPNGVRYKQ